MIILKQSLVLKPKKIEFNLRYMKILILVFLILFNFRNSASIQAQQGFDENGSIACATDEHHQLQMEDTSFQIFYQEQERELQQVLSNFKAQRNFVQYT